jgi:Arc/MetJ-type ribon-helix-helix transcriptional regulator
METKTISLRISSREAALIETLARQLKLTQSDVLKEGLAALQEKLRQERSAYDTGKDLFGRHGSGRRDLSERRKEIFRETVREKLARR